MGTGERRGGGEGRRGGGEQTPASRGSAEAKPSLPVISRDLAHRSIAARPSLRLGCASSPRLVHSYSVTSESYSVRLGCASFLVAASAGTVALARRGERGFGGVTFADAFAGVSETRGCLLVSPRAAGP